MAKLLLLLGFYFVCRVLSNCVCLGHIISPCFYFPKLDQDISYVELQRIWFESKKKKKREYLCSRTGGLDRGRERGDGRESVDMKETSGVRLGSLLRGWYITFTCDEGVGTYRHGVVVWLRRSCTGRHRQVRRLDPSCPIITPKKSQYLFVKPWLHRTNNKKVLLTFWKSTRPKSPYGDWKDDFLAGGVLQLRERVMISRVDMYRGRAQDVGTAHRGAGVGWRSCTSSTSSCRLTRGQDDCLGPASLSRFLSDISVTTTHSPRPLPRSALLRYSPTPTAQTSAPKALEPGRTLETPLFFFFGFVLDGREFVLLGGGRVGLLRRRGRFLTTSELLFNNEKRRTPDTTMYHIPWPSHHPTSPIFQRGQHTSFIRPRCLRNPETETRHASCTTSVDIPQFVSLISRLGPHILLVVALHSCIITNWGTDREVETKGSFLFLYATKHFLSDDDDDGERQSIDQAKPSRGESDRTGHQRRDWRRRLRPKPAEYQNIYFHFHPHPTSTCSPSSWPASSTPHPTALGGILKKRRLLPVLHPQSFFPRRPRLRSVGQRLTTNSGGSHKTTTMTHRPRLSAQG
ncbi:putative signal peptide protein [Puccinia sorghi]|uniref:Putative signal peptide protein n=1 Tax=Puccinia sorghi TaxID=27349 RepID=A0A0L6UKV0_9BASI|nr:putative signal peptide protein [Puccinia sorghi]